MTLLHKILPNDLKKRKWIAAIITIIIAAPLTLLGIYGIGKYGIALFILTPFFIGFSSTILFGYKTDITHKQAVSVALLTLGIFAFGLILCAIEGAICIAMVTPLAAVFTYIGTLIALGVLNKIQSSLTPLAVLLLALTIPLTSFLEADTAPTLTAVTTSVEINATIETVWKNVIQFPRLEEPSEFLFKAGIAYPTDATITGTGVGAIRQCNFSTGSFVEPITTWHSPYLLKFDVVQQPKPMTELSFWNIDAPHLHDYFASKHGQFNLTKIGPRKTLLEGTTWYTNNIHPEFYWNLWSNYIVHKIHKRVLEHIKSNSERTEMK